MLAVEERIEPVNKGLLAARYPDQASHVLRRVDRVRPDIAFILEVRPGAAYRQIGLRPAAVQIARPDEAGHTAGRKARVPQGGPVARARRMALPRGSAPESACQFRDREIVVGILDRA